MDNFFGFYHQSQCAVIYDCITKHPSTRPLYYELKEMPDEELEKHGDECCDMEVCTECGATTLECSTKENSDEV
tara:strand:+ start:1433 stop:1654 length:222 start_codon:yes stop_codon:yes gene_type:complete